MIGYLRGTVLAIENDSVLLEVNQIGYQLLCAEKNHASLRAGDEAIFYVETIMRENEMLLYGFSSLAERRYFRLLCSVQGVGAKMALALLSAFSLTDLSQAIMRQDNQFLTQATGVGQKLAQRMIHELADKLPKDDGALNPITAPDDMSTASLQALIQLGFSNQQASQALHDVRKQHDVQSVDELLRLALRALGRQ